MADRGVRTTIPEVVERFAAYRDDNAVWGSLHVVLDDGNVENLWVEGCIEDAVRRNDREGEALARILLSMSRTQRKKLPHAVYKFRRNRTPEKPSAPPEESA